MSNLKTPYSVDHGYHPRPQFKREKIEILNGTWHFQAKDYNGDIIVPFPPESPLSKVERITTKKDCLVYSRTFFVKKEGRQLLHFDGVDNFASVYINGNLVGKNAGGYIPFAFDITEYVAEGENEVKVIVTDPLDRAYPYGKQRHKRGGMWYTPISGIWKSVWLEYVPQCYVEGIKIDTDLNSLTLTVVGGEKEKTLIIDDKRYDFLGERITVSFENPRLWTPETPNLYNFTLLCGEDKIESYFALRTVTVEKGRLALNGKPYFFHGLLDQGYYPDGIFTPASHEGYKEDILKMKELGFNTLRKHIKIEPDIFYYYCDLYGMAVFQDMVNNGHYSFIYDTALPTVGVRRLPKWVKSKTRKNFYKTATQTVELLYNHPSVVYYTIYNEGWGQSKAKQSYRLLSSFDKTRIWDTTSGWFKSKHSDVQSEHIYFKKANFKISKKPALLTEFGGYSCRVEGHCFNSKTYGYKICKDKETFTNDLKNLYLNEVVPLVKKGLCGCILTQLSDIEDETNGIVTYDRKVVKADKESMLLISEELKKASK